MRTLVLDVHARFAEVAVNEDGELRRIGRIATKHLPAFAGSLSPEDHVVLESTSISYLPGVGFSIIRELAPEPTTGPACFPLIAIVRAAGRALHHERFRG